MRWLKSSSKEIIRYIPINRLNKLGMGSLFMSHFSQFLITSTEASGKSKGHNLKANILRHYMQNMIELLRGSYMSAHVLFNLLNKMGKSYKMRGLSRLFCFFVTSSIINQ